jgi:hypothetical protein
VKRWGIAFLVVLLACIPIYLGRSRSPDLLKDTDTKVLLETVRKTHQPLSWFAGDWPLKNHFYRPVATLTFEMDNALYGDNAEGYGRTNALFAIACVLLLFWFLREITNKPAMSAASAVLFSLWLSNLFFENISALFWMLGVVGLVLSLLPGRKFTNGLIAFLTAGYASAEIYAFHTNQEIGSLNYFMVGWLPGRTASVMTVFALIAMASYARYERMSSEMIPVELGPQDPPATKSTTLREVKAKWAWVWIGLAAIATALALGTYEQAVMLPAALFGVAVSMRLQRYKVRWLWHILFWGLLFAYLMLRRHLLPPGTSDYQKQQMRFSGSVYWSIMDYAFPFASILWQALANADMGFGMIFGITFWPSILLTVQNIVGFVAARRKWVFALTGWALSLITFLPMAWLKPFEHYHFWPMAMRSLFAVTMAWVAIETFVTAASRPALQAPVRLDPAPGSLPRP